ncbi:MAG: hypothetical protein RLP44_30470 [Aggregatilineales bacterium]
METLADHLNIKSYGDSPHWMQPYQCFMGRWEGLCKTFTKTGDFIESAAVHMDVYWMNEAKTLWHLHEDFDNLYGVGHTVFHSDIYVDKKFCQSENELVKLEGSMITPYNYVFTIWSAATKSTVYNNHYFIDANTRRIITHKLRDNETHIYQIQDFVRVG